jgi:hypothetical protein
MATLVGATQKQVDNEYYMLDLVTIATNTRKQKGLQKLELLNIVNSEHLEKSEYKELVERFVREAGIEEQQQKFSRDKFEELRALKG